MKRAATLLVWLALLFGLPQVVICGVMIFSAGWLLAPLVLIFLLLPFVPLILMQEIHRWQRLPPAATASAAVLSIAASGSFYWMLYYRMASA
jgi:hypothetical protein